MAAKRLLKSIKIDIKRSEPLIVCNGRRLVKLKYTGAWSKRKRQKSLQFVSCVLQTSPMALAPDTDSEGFIKLQSSEVFRFIKGVCSGVVSSTVNSGFKMTNLCTFMFHPSELGRMIVLPLPRLLRLKKTAAPVSVGSLRRPYEVSVGESFNLQLYQLFEIICFSFQGGDHLCATSLFLLPC